MTAAITTAVISILIPLLFLGIGFALIVFFESREVKRKLKTKYPETGRVIYLDESEKSLSE